MQLIDALELLITPDDPDDFTKEIEFTWDIMAYSDNYIWL